MTYHGQHAKVEISSNGEDWVDIGGAFHGAIEPSPFLGEPITFLYNEPDRDFDTIEFTIPITNVDFMIDRRGIARLRERLRRGTSPRRAARRRHHKRLKQR